MKTELDKLVSDKCKIDLQNLKKPRLKLVGVKGNYDHSTVRESLINQNLIECKEDALAFLNARIVNIISNNNKILIIFMDLAKAFDTVNHVRLLKKLERYGIRGTSNELLKSYLSNRK